VHRPQKEAQQKSRNRRIGELRAGEKKGSSFSLCNLTVKGKDAIVNAPHYNRTIGPDNDKTTE
jgi:hypothetical protein